MALNNNISQPALLKPHAYFNFNDAPVVSFYLASPVKQSGLVRKMERDKGIEPSYPAWKAGALANVLIPQMGGALRGMPREDRNFKERGEDFLYSCIYYNKNF